MTPIDPERLVLNRAITLPPSIGPGRQLIRWCCRTACLGWTGFALANPTLWPIAASAWVGWYLLAAKLRIA